MLVTPFSTQTLKLRNIGPGLNLTKDCLEFLVGLILMLLRYVLYPVTQLVKICLVGVWGRASPRDTTNAGMKQKMCLKKSRIRPKLSPSLTFVKNQIFHPRCMKSSLRISWCEEAEKNINLLRQADVYFWGISSSSQVDPWSRSWAVFAQKDLFVKTSPQNKFCKQVQAGQKRQRQHDVTNCRQTSTNIGYKRRVRRESRTTKNWIRGLEVAADVVF